MSVTCGKIAPAEFVVAMCRDFGSRQVGCKQLFNLLQAEASYDNNVVIPNSVLHASFSVEPAIEVNSNGQLSKGMRNVYKNTSGPCIADGLPRNSRM